MHGKMQESGLTETIPFICISAVWGQCLSEELLVGSVLLGWGTPGGVSAHGGAPSGVSTHGEHLVGSVLIGGAPSGISAHRGST